jgi:hypothetical protein
LRKIRLVAAASPLFGAEAKFGAWGWAQKKFDYNTSLKIREILYNYFQKSTWLRETMHFSLIQRRAYLYNVRTNLFFPSQSNASVL